MAIVLIAGLARPAAAGMAEAEAAYDRGDYETAHAELRPLAEAGHAAAQLYLGVMSENGQGLPRDDAAALVPPGGGAGVCDGPVLSGRYVSAGTRRRAG